LKKNTNKTSSVCI